MEGCPDRLRRVRWDAYTCLRALYSLGLLLLYSLDCFVPEVLHVDIDWRRVTSSAAGEVSQLPGARKEVPVCEAVGRALQAYTGRLWVRGSSLTSMPVVIGFMLIIQPLFDC
eukprot:1180421-Prorocentrum_minimum.AAC.4